jgi:hypothetical protein
MVASKRAWSALGSKIKLRHSWKLPKGQPSGTLQGSMAAMEGMG